VRLMKWMPHLAVRWSVEDVLAMVRLGILAEDSTTELLGGLVVVKDRGDATHNRGRVPERSMAAAGVFPPPNEQTVGTPWEREVAALRLYRFTVDQYQRLIEAGILPEDSSHELIRGIVVRRDNGGATGSIDTDRD
jgi:hypothetical protein